MPPASDSRRADRPLVLLGKEPRTQPDERLEVHVEETGIARIPPPCAEVCGGSGHGEAGAGAGRPAKQAFRLVTRRVSWLVLHTTPSLGASHSVPGLLRRPRQTPPLSFPSRDWSEPTATTESLAKEAQCSRCIEPLARSSWVAGGQASAARTRIWLLDSAFTFRSPDLAGLMANERPSAGARGWDAPSRDAQRTQVVATSPVPMPLLLAREWM